VIELQIEAILGMDKESCVNTKDLSYRGDLLIHLLYTELNGKILLFPSSIFVSLTAQFSFHVSTLVIWLMNFILGFRIRKQFDDL